MPQAGDETVKLSVVVPCFDEERTLRTCVERVLAIAEAQLSLEVIIVDDCSRDASFAIARELADKHPEVVVLHHEKNQGKGAALRTGFREATGDYVAVQDADLEYDPTELKRLLAPLVRNQADVVMGSRFVSYGAHRVLYFWHSVGNRFLTLLSNIFTDLNLTDMETCYKVFRREVIQSIDIEEDRFGFEPEIVAKVAQRRLRIYEVGISYYGRTYEEGKKIGMKDGFRALYCILRYNAHRAPAPVQFLLYLLIGAAAAILNLLVFEPLYAASAPLAVAAPIAFLTAGAVTYVLCVLLLFRRQVRWASATEGLVGVALIGALALVDFLITREALRAGMAAASAKLLASAGGLVLSFAGLRYLVFPEPRSGPWRSSQIGSSER
jgi:glycosyltransferase involved in cell wall biosynthesis